MKNHTGASDAFSPDPDRFAGRENFFATERLDVAPLTREESERYLTDVRAFAQTIKLAAPPEEPNDETRAALNWLIDEGLKYDAKMSVWWALWAIVERETGKFVGCADFKGNPIDGEVEIGYGIDPKMQNRGFMTEALKGFVAWGRKRPDLRGIVAETLKTNAASQKCLERAGFRRADDKPSEEDAFFWRVSFRAE